MAYQAYQEAWEPSPSPLDRTIDLGVIDWDAIITRLISPAGMVTQFALSLESTIIETGGYVALGLLWQLAIGSFGTVPGIGGALQSLSVVFGTQGLALTITRSIYNTVRSLVSRLLVTFLYYGAPATLEGLASVSISTVTDFLFDPDLVFLATGRAFAQFVIFLLAIVPIYLFSVFVYPGLRPIIPRSSSSLLPDYLAVDPLLQSGDVAAAISQGAVRVISGIMG